MLNNKLYSKLNFIKLLSKFLRKEKAQIFNKKNK